MRGNVDLCVTLLESLGYSQISYRAQRNELRFSREEGRNPTSMRLKVDTLKFDGFSTNLHGDVYTLVMETENLSFPQALKYIAKALNFKTNQFNQKIRLPFGGFYKGLIREVQEPEYSMQTYDESILDEYSGCNMLFFKDGIDFKTQEYFNVGYDLESGRITIPEYTFDGKLCGIMGRLNDNNCPKEERWFPIIPCSRSLTLYGYHYNYQTIQQKNIAIIGESEKFVQQLHAMGNYTGLASCGCDISPVQAKHLKMLMTKTLILAYDEGLSEDQVRAQAEKLMLNNSVFCNRVGYIYDRDNLILPKGSKASPSDFGQESFEELIKNHVIWI